jgi:integrase
MGKQFTRTNSENLVRHAASGTYYLNAKIHGKKIRHSLETKNLRTAQDKRDLELARLRGAQIDATIRTLGDALELIAHRKASEISLKASTRKYYTFALATLRRIMPITLKKWPADAQRTWWKTNTATRSAAWINNTHAVVLEIVAAARDAGLPIDPCPLKRVPRKRQKESTLPTRSDFTRIVSEVRRMKKSHSEESADMIEFLAWSGLRIAELRSVQWEHIGPDWLTVTGGEHGTKNHEVRRVPISAPLREIIQRRHYPGAAGPVFELNTPRESLKNACARLKIAHVRVHDLRHLFATLCIESGIDIPTVAGWLGHKDKGALLMKTYGHLRDDHSLAAVKLLG